MSLLLLKNDYSGTFSIQNASCNNGLCQANVVLMKKLNFDQKSVYSLEILAKDGSNRSNKINKTKQTIVLNVEDAQNNPPVFLTDAKTHFVEENSPIVNQTKNVYFEQNIIHFDSRVKKL